jgi:hypothetical protein
VDAAADIGQPLSVLVLGEPCPAEALEAPAWDPANERLKAQTMPEPEARRA